MLSTVLKKSDHKVIYMALFSLILLPLLFSWLYLFKKPLKEYQMIKHQRGIMQSKVLTDTLIDEKLANTKKEIGRLKQKIEGENPSIPTNELIALIIDKLDSISAGHDVELIAIRPEKSRKENLFEEVPFRIEVAGDYLSLYDWMLEMEERIGPMVVKKFAITQDYKKGKLLMKLSIVSYRLTREDE